MLQEVWGTSISLLYNPLQPSHSFSPHISLWKPNTLIENFFATLINTTVLRLKKSGGLAYAIRKEYPVEWTKKITYQKSATNSGKGIQGGPYL